MKCVIFAGGYGTRIKTENDNTPKSLVTIGDDPIILHILKIYYKYGIKDFILCLGYGQEKFKEYFIDLINRNSDLEISYKDKRIKILKDNFLDFNISLIDTGVDTLTGGRLKRVEKYLQNEEEFLLTYGDAVSDVNITNLINHHHSKNKLITITSVKRKENFGVIKFDEDNNVISFNEKAGEDAKWINAGFMVVNKKVLDYLTPDSGPFEKEVLEKLTPLKQVSAYLHEGFWQCMDNQTERAYLHKLITNNEAPWLK